MEGGFTRLGESSPAKNHSAPVMGKIQFADLIASSRRVKEALDSQGADRSYDQVCHFPGVWIPASAQAMRYTPLVPGRLFLTGFPLSTLCSQFVARVSWNMP